MVKMGGRSWKNWKPIKPGSKKSRQLAEQAIRNSVDLYVSSEAIAKNPKHNMSGILNFLNEKHEKDLNLNLYVKRESKPVEKIFIKLNKDEANNLFSAIKGHFEESGILKLSGLFDEVAAQETFAEGMIRVKKHLSYLKGEEKSHYFEMLKRETGKKIDAFGCSQDVRSKFIEIFDELSESMLVNPNQIAVSLFFFGVLEHFLIDSMKRH